ncbi:hypothetical protein HMPREF9565_02183 [Cutibacterium acnes HL053PA2]|nr:hypothetical protein HMPREF9567_01569 [Cutibacterium acnes HL013PA1]EFS43378.1 hypothetical protein HMPREF9576_01430 [Cutibacterium acnes HL110PA2]EFS68392.1 hypothetical protein HMPREF9616_01785 [Cutibacterium acnes HL007PA1]EFS89324.1 hypothetical protein HMPREF9606_01658 [Cutibacterium acnes HL036PA3]EFT04357.1 hypothetical protein HMPREF9614_02339 [Cutibacterium acnes HL002PA2]EFT12199.1 hypothetical protein HMPREF9620_01896 [Cutibacterium acnes HL037PA1]EFT20368.1 hypothetical protein
MLRTDTTPNQPDSEWGHLRRPSYLDRHSPSSYAGLKWPL